MTLIPRLPWLQRNRNLAARNPLGLNRGIRFMPVLIAEGEPITQRCLVRGLRACKVLPRLARSNPLHCNYRFPLSG